jgi:hypothetical protein
MTWTQDGGEWPVLDSVKAAKLVERLGDSQFIEYNSATLNLLLLR